MRTLITAGTVLTPLEAIPNGAVLVEDGRIVACGPRADIDDNGADKLDFPDAVLAPGFIDVHVHGSAGLDTMDTGVEGYGKIGRFLARHGVTSYLPTTLTAPEDRLLSALAVMGTAIGSPPKGTLNAPCARPIGIHLEGPFLSDARNGGHPAAYIQKPTVEALDRFVKASRGAIRILTLAPELPGAIDLIRDAVERGITVSIGHTNADFNQSQEAIDAGARHATHTFNSMRRLKHREPGVVAAVLSDQRVYADIIADGLHVHPPVVDLFLRCKGPDRAILISDAISMTGMPSGHYHIGEFEVEIDGLRVESHGKIGGSALTLEVAVQNVIQFARWSLHEAVRLVTINPARLLNLEHKGRIVPGADADLVLLSPEGDVRSTFIAGQGI